jgi:C1A family cysteine protease
MLLVKNFFIIVTFGASMISSANLLNRRDEWSEFMGFLKQFEKKYESLEALEARFDIFRQNLKEILEHNSIIGKNFTMGVNQFTDLSPEEFKADYANGLGLGVFGVDKTACKTYAPTGKVVPDSWDWREHGAVTPVKNQGQCGSCWSFSASGAMEGAWAIKTTDIISISEQQLVDCSKKYGNLGCKGGFMDNAFQYAIDNGMCSEESYPYTSGVTKTGGSCVDCKPVVSIKGCSDVPPNNQVALKEAVALIGPISIALDAETKLFQSYKSGVITSESCGTNLDHGVLIVGYGEEDGIKYWLVKNSWGASWGDAGYIKISRSESKNDAGICGIAMQPSFPII